MENALLKKLKVKADDHFLVINAPEGYFEYLKSFHTNIYSIHENLVQVNVLQIFVTLSIQLVVEIKKLTAIIKPETKIWISYPKKSTGIFTDLGMMNSWQELAQFQLRPVAAISIDDNWTALQLKKIDFVKKSNSSNSEIANSDFAEYINQEKRTVEIPRELLKQLTKEQTIFFESLSFTNKKEYIVWILSAKQEKTKVSRISQTIEKLNSKKKNPTEK